MMIRTERFIVKWLRRMFSRLERMKGIGLITVFGAILTGRQSGQKLQCLYGNTMANKFFQN